MKLSTRILLGFCIVLILSIIDTASNYLLSVKVEKNIDFVTNSQEIIRNSGKIHKAMIDMQSSFRGYLLTQDTSFLDGYNSGLREIPLLFIGQKKLVKNNARQLAILDSINMLHLQWIGYSDALIDTRRNMATSQTAGIIYARLFEDQLRRKIGKKINDNITRKFIEFDKTEYEVRAVHSRNLISSIQRTHIFSIMFFSLTIIVGIGTTIYIVLLISKRIKTMVRLADSISKGNFTKLEDYQKDELTSLSTSLNIMSDSLRKNISELENRNAELDKFAYVVSHDLKAPIRGIHNVIKWIEEDLGNELSPQMKKYLDIIPQRTKRMEDLINGLLDYARVREKTKPEKTDVNEMIRQVVEEIVPRGFSVKVENLPVIDTEHLKLRQVFTNLISNAVKYTPHANGQISIRCEELEHCYEFSVKDNGIGIDPEYHEKIFEMFQTLREKDEKESTGIGLAIIKKILEEQHCAIRVKSVLGQGAEFIFTWPHINPK